MAKYYEVQVQRWATVLVEVDDAANCDPVEMAQEQVDQEDYYHEGEGFTLATESRGWNDEATCKEVSARYFEMTARIARGLAGLKTEAPDA